MNVSGILVIVPVAKLDATIDALGTLTGVDVHHVDRDRGRMIVTQEAESIPLEVEGLKRIQALPHVTLAEMVHHHFEDDRQILQGIPEELQDERPARVPPFLQTDP